MNKKYIIFFLLVCLRSLVFGQTGLDMKQKIPFDATIKKGVLPNGLTYYIRHNEYPKNRACYYLIQNVGSVLENDKQNGLAHFLEHMAFNGTSTFPGNTMVDFLERNGVKFGQEVNAYTSTNETVNNISNVSTSNPHTLDSCLLILHDWCNELSLDGKEIDAERGVIYEEWRSKIGPETRIRDQIANVKFNGSIYSKRNVIGDMNIVKNFDYKELRDFYHDWYRTDLQAIAIVGDVDVNAVEKKIKAVFSTIPAVANAKKRSVPKIADNEKPLYVAATDKELKTSDVYLYIRQPQKPENTLQDLRQKYVSNIFIDLLNKRLKDLSDQPGAAFLKADVAYTELVKGYNTFIVDARTSEIKMLKGFEAVYDEIQRVANFGFTDGEISRIKTNILASADNKYKDRDEISSDSYAKAIKTSYLYGTPIPDQEFNHQFTKSIVPGITSAELKAYAAQFFSDKNRAYIVEGPGRFQESYPKLFELEQVIKDEQHKLLKPYVESVMKDSVLLSEKLKGGKIVSEKYLKDFDAYEWKLSNGAKVVYKYANYQKNTVQLDAVGDGGTSLYDVSDFPSLAAASGYVKYFGLGKFDNNSLEKVLTGKTASTGFSIDTYSQSVLGSSSTKDVETMLQMAYMRFAEPRFDRKKFDELKAKSAISVSRNQKNSSMLMKDTINSIIRNGNPRYVEMNKAYINQIDFDRMKELYKERFADAGEFTFYIVGDVDKETIKPLVEKYIGAIKGIDRKESYRVFKDYYPHGKKQLQIKIPMEEPKSTVFLKLMDEGKYSRKKVIYQAILASILKLRYLETIREKEGATYSVGVNGTSYRTPEQKKNGLMNQNLTISFQCGPEKAEYLKSLVYKELEKSKKEISQVDLDKVLLNLKKESENRKENNNFWMTALQAYYSTGEDMAQPTYLEDILNNVSVSDIQNAAKDFLKKADVLDIIFYPKDIVSANKEYNIKTK